MFYIYQIREGRYVTVKGITLGMTKLMKNVARWDNKRHAKTWENAVKEKYPDAELKEATLSLI